MVNLKLFLTMLIVSAFNVTIACGVILNQTPQFHYNTVLQGSAFTGIWKISLHECVTECGRRNTCASGNYFRLLKLCQLNTQSSKNVVVTNQTSVVFFEMSESVKEDIIKRFCGNRTCDDGRRCDTDNKTQECRVQECMDDPRARIIAKVDASVNYVGAKRLVDCGVTGNESVDALRNVTTVISTCRTDGTWSLPAVCPYHQTSTPSLPQTTRTTTTTTTEPIVTTSTVSATSTKTTPPSSTTTTTPENAGCDDEWEMYGRHCYFFPNEQTNTWTEAKRYCRGYMSNLVSFDDEDQFRFVEELIIGGQAVGIMALGPVSYWTGGTFYDDNGWFWEPRNESNARPIRYFKWRDMTDPANTDLLVNVLKCIDLEQDDGQYGDRMSGWYYKSVQCDSNIERKLICQKNTRKEPGISPTTTPISPAPPTDVTTQANKCDGEWDNFHDHCYHKSRETSSTWTEAKGVCERLESDLVSIDDNAQFQFLEDLVDQSNKVDSGEEETSFWIGGKYDDDEGWRWIPRDKSKPREITYFRWNNKKSLISQNSVDECLTLVISDNNSDWFYSGVTCDADIERHILCQKRSKEQVGTTTSTTSPALTSTTTTANTPTSTTTSSTTTTSTEVAPTSTAQVICEQDGEKFGNQCFYFKLEPVSTWKEAQRVCSSFDAEAATIHSDEQFDFLATKLNSLSQDIDDSFWVGGIVENGQWRWYQDQNFEQMLYFRWHTAGSGDTAIELHCLALRRDAGDLTAWYYSSVSCSGWIGMFVICQRAGNAAN